MLNSKKIGIICGVLMTAAVIFVVFMILNPWQSEDKCGVVTYENGQSIEFSDSDYYSDYKKQSYQHLELGGKDISILSSGVYELSGELNGSVNIDAPGGGVVKIVLNGAHITSENSAAINVQKAAKVVILLAPESENSVTDSSVRDDAELDGAIYSKADLVICGDGMLAVKANYSDGIKANDSLKITGGNISVTAVDDAVNVNDYAAFVGGKLTLVSGGHGIKCENTGEADLGFAVIDGTELNIESGNDGMQTGGDIYVNNTQAKISVADDGIHTDKTLFLNGGSVNITKCTEGMEGKYIVMNGGEYNIIAEDDALNASGEGSFMMPMGGGRGNGEIYLTINGGKIYAEVAGDGLDSNGAAQINGGYIEVYGPENSGNSTLDFDGGFAINGGTVLAAGSSGMAESPSESSAQNTIVVYLGKTYDAQTSFSLKNEGGEEIVKGTSAKRFDWLCISSPEIKTDGAYTVTVGENEVNSATISSQVTTVGERVGRGGMPQMNRGGF